MKKITLIMLISFVPFLSMAQGWQRLYGDTVYNYGTSFAQTTDSGFIITGATQGPHTYSDVYLIRTDKNGDTLWTRTFGGANIDYGNSVKQTPDKGFIVAGVTASFNTSHVNNIYLVKTDSNGLTQWSKAFGDTVEAEATAVVTTADGGYCVTGDKGDIFNGTSDAYLLKTDANGDTVWTKRFGASQYQFGYALQQTSDDGFIITGAKLNAVTGFYDVYLIKTNSKGDSIWTKTYSGNTDSYGNAIIQSSDGGYAIGGYIGGNYYIIKTDSNGIQQWANQFVVGGNDRAYSIIQTTDGYVLVGDIYTVQATNGMLLKVDANGNEIWSKIFDGDSFAAMQAVGNSFVMAGSANNNAGTGLVLLLKTDCENYPNVNIFTNDTTFFCTNTNDTVSVTLQSTATDATNYQWTKNNVNINGATSATYTADSAGTYVLMASDINGCSNPSNAITVYVGGPPPVPVIMQMGNTLSAEAQFVRYQWYLNDTLIPGATNYFYVINRPGKYTLEAMAGCNSFSNPFMATLSGVENLNGDVSVSISPNPFSNSTTLNIINKSGLEMQDLQFTLYDVLGRAVFQSEIINSQLVINRETLSNGIYFYRVNNTAGEVAEGKVVIQ